MFRCCVNGLLLAAAIVLTGCESGFDTPAPSEQPPAAVQTEPPLPASPVLGPALYQPTVHALLALHGGAGTGADAAPLVTEWRRDGDDNTFNLTLRPDEVTVRTLSPGRYTLISAMDEAGRVYIAPGTGGPSVRAFDLQPGEVVYGGLVLMREGGGNAAVIEVGARNTAARAAIQLEYPQQARRMKIRLLQVAK